MSHTEVYRVVRSDGTRTKFFYHDLAVARGQATRLTNERKHWSYQGIDYTYKVQKATGEWEDV